VLYTPLPDESSIPIHEVAKVRLRPGEKAKVTVEPDSQGETHHIPAVAISKYSGATYGIEVDETERYGPHAPVPPTDPDDLEATFLRALRMTREMVVTIRDVRETGSARDYQIHVLGWEE